MTVHRDSAEWLGTPLEGDPVMTQTKRFAPVAEWLRQLPASTAIIDGEVAHALKRMCRGWHSVKCVDHLRGRIGWPPTHGFTLGAEM
jgi:hypothetical protein